jgi:hypothetical protein
MSITVVKVSLEMFVVADHMLLVCNAFSCFIAYECIYTVTRNLHYVLQFRDYFLFNYAKRQRRTPVLRTSQVYYRPWNSKVNEQTFVKILQWEMLLRFLRFYYVYADCPVIRKYGYWLPLEWYCIFSEAGSANSVSAIVSGKKGGKTNNNSFCFVSV